MTHTYLLIAALPSSPAPYLNFCNAQYVYFMYTGHYNILSMYVCMYVGFMSTDDLFNYIRLQR